MLARGWGTSIIDNPGAHEEDLLVAAGSWDHRKKKRRRSRERERNDGGPGEDAALVRRGQYLREGLGSTSFSATERNCTGWGTLIYWVITDLGAKRARGVWAFSPARVLRDLFRTKWLGRMRWIRKFRNLIKKSAWKSIRVLTRRSYNVCKMSEIYNYALVSCYQKVKMSRELNHSYLDIC